jgi:mono/diheme cytochrome c family protein
MKRILIIVALLAIGGAAAYGILNRTDGSAGAAPPLAGAPPAADALARGEYLTRAADCEACHSVPGADQPFAGGVAFALPFGTLYSTNITADAATGIGAWSDEDFVRAVREGIRPDGTHLYPAFPYTAYTGLSRADVLAIKSYLFSLPRVNAPNRANELKFPFNQRWAVGFWNAAFFKSARFAADPEKSAALNRGAYLATALGHCGECHTPRNFAFAPEHRHALSGADMLGWRAYNITPDPTYGIGAWSDEDLAKYLTRGHAEGRGSAAGPMGEAVERSLQYLHPEDTAALVAYLRSVPAQRGAHPVIAGVQLAPPSPAEAPKADSALTEGRQLFAGVCASCHQWNGRGLETHYAALQGSRGINDPNGLNVTEAILHGVKLKIADTEVFMPAFGAGYSDSEVAALSNFVIAQFGNRSGQVTPQDVALRRSGQ